MIHRLLVLTVAACFLFASSAKSSASEQGRINEALAAAQDWIAQIDAGQYEESYSFASTVMQQKVPKDNWVLVLKTLRVPWGPVVSRKEVSHDYKPDGTPELRGECIYITYETSFKKMTPALEVVVLKWEDGKWLGAGYNAGPKPKPASEQTPTDQPPQTEVSTEKKTVSQTQADQTGK